MEALTDALIGFDPDIDDALGKGLRALSARLASYAHAPLNEAQVRRMDRFSRTPGLCDYVDRFLQSCWVGGECFEDVGVGGVS